MHPSRAAVPRQAVREWVTSKEPATLDTTGQCDSEFGVSR